MSEVFDPLAARLNRRRLLRQAGGAAALAALAGPVALRPRAAHA